MPRNISATRLIIAFIAGFISVLVFHQGMLTLLHAVHFTPRSPFPTAPTKPFGVPQIWSLAFWGGVWGIAFVAIVPRFLYRFRYWVAALVFGALGPTLVSWFVVMPLKGQPVGGGWQLPAIVTGLLVNAAWGLGTALLLPALSKWRRL